MTAVGSYELSGKHLSGSLCWSRIIRYGTAYLIRTYRSRVARISLFVHYRE